jgi:hypothetical protein
MDPVSSATSAAVTNVSDSKPNTVRGAAAVSVLKTALNSQASSAAQLIQSVQQPALATSGALGTQLNTYA